MISKEELKEFKKIYKKSFGEYLSDQVVLEKVTRLLNLVKAVYQPMTKEEYDKVQKRREEKNDKEEEETRNNLVGFFSLLLKIDMRINPQSYKLKKPKNEKNNAENF